MMFSELLLLACLFASFCWLCGGEMLSIHCIVDAPPGWSVIFPGNVYFCTHFLKWRVTLQLGPGSCHPRHCMGPVIESVSFFPLALNESFESRFPHGRYSSQMVTSKSTPQLQCLKLQLFRCLIRPHPFWLISVPFVWSVTHKKNNTLSITQICHSFATLTPTCDGFAKTVWNLISCRARRQHAAYAQANISPSKRQKIWCEMRNEAKKNKPNAKSVGKKN